MKKTLRFVLLACLLASPSGISFARFDYMFQVSQLHGTCMVKTPGESEFREVIEHKAYLFGSELRLMPESSAVLSFSPDSTMKISLGATLKVNSKTDKANGDKMTVSTDLFCGQCDVKLEKDFQNLNGFEIEVAGVRVVGIEGAEFEVSASETTDTKQGEVKCNNGAVMVMNRHFTIPRMLKDNRLGITSSRDLNYLSLSNIKGIYNINLKNSTGNVISSKLESDSAVKFWEKKSPYSNVLSASVLIIGPDGCSTNAVASYTEAYVKDLLPMLTGDSQESGEVSGESGTEETWTDDSGFDLGNGFDF